MILCCRQRLQLLLPLISTGLFSPLHYVRHLTATGLFVDGNIADCAPSARIASDGFKNQFVAATAVSTKQQVVAPCMSHNRHSSTAGAGKLVMDTTQMQLCRGEGDLSWYFLCASTHAAMQGGGGQL